MGSASFTVYQEFDRLLEEQSPMESYVEWLDTMVDRCVVKVGRAEGKGQPWLPRCLVVSVDPE